MKHIYLLTVFFLLIGCRPELTLNEEPFTRHIVVEGSIENDRHPIVYLTYNGPFFATIDKEELINRTIRHAKVTVSDGEEKEVLTGHYRDEFPFFVYRGHTLKGVSGKTYLLTIQCDDYTITAHTTIPPVVPLTSHYMISRNDTLNQLHICFNHRPTPPIANYKVFTYIPELNRSYIPTLSVINLQHQKEGAVDLPVLKGFDKTGRDSIDLFFHKNDPVYLKFCTIDSSSNEFWQSFNNENLSDLNLFTGSATQLKSNVSSPAVGIWCGYGSSYYRVQ